MAYLTAVKTLMICLSAFCTEALVAELETKAIDDTTFQTSKVS